MDRGLKAVLILKAAKYQLNIYILVCNFIVSMILV